MEVRARATAEIAGCRRARSRCPRRPAAAATPARSPTGKESRCGHVAAAVDRRFAAARREAGLTLLVTSGYRPDAEQARLFAAKPMRPDIELAEVEGRPGRARYVFADKAAVMIAVGKHSTENREAYWAQVITLQAGAAAFVNFVGVTIEKALDDAHEGRA